MSKSRKERALTALLTCNTLTETAEKVGVSRRTLYTWIHEDELFAKRYRDMVQGERTAVLEEMRRARTEAVNTLLSLMQDCRENSRVRLDCAKAIIEATKLVDHDTLTIANDAITASDETWSGFFL